LSLRLSSTPLYISGARHFLPVGEWRIRPETIVLHY
jgi:hypothetical protein